MSVYREQDRERDVKIVAAMGWTDISISPMGHAAGRPPDPEATDGVRGYQGVPFFHVNEPCIPEGEIAKAMLLYWLAEDRDRFVAFLLELENVLILTFDPPYMAEKMQKAMTALPAQIAIAAMKALRLEEEE